VQHRSAAESNCEQQSELQRVAASSKQFLVGVPHKKKNKKRAFSVIYSLRWRVHLGVHGVWA
jgi:hypothetical protein